MAIRPNFILAALPIVAITFVTHTMVECSTRQFKMPRQAAGQ
ncbi:MAG: hypothetical protein ABI330_11620 [Caldimonas sp.]